MKAKDILDHAANLVSGDRQKTYGDVLRNHENIATLWNAYLKIRRDPSAPLTAADVARMEELLKMARGEVGVVTLDTFADGAAFAAITGEIALREEG